MALRSLATKMQTSAAAAARIPSASRVSPASGSRALPFSSSNPFKSARDWYLFHLEHYDNVSRQLTIYSREVYWTGRLAKALNWFYMVGVTCIAGTLILKGISLSENAGEPPAASLISDD